MDHTCGTKKSRTGIKKPHTKLYQKPIKIRTLSMHTSYQVSTALRNNIQYKIFALSKTKSSNNTHMPRIESLRSLIYSKMIVRNIA